VTSMLPRELAAPPSDVELEELARDGAIALRGVLDRSWIESIRGAIERALADPSATAREYTKASDPGRYFGDFFLWRQSDDRPGTFLESPQMRAELPDLGLRDGDPFRGDLFPQVWPRSD